jgi:hypothetical protein
MHSEMNSEFPETTFYKVTRRFGWFFSPLLLITLVVFTIFIAEGLSIDFKNGSVEKKGSIEIKELKNGVIQINNQDRGKTPSLIDFTSTSPVELKVTKEARHDWTKTVTPQPGFVRTYYPILYPKDLSFSDVEIPTSNVYSNPDANFFFYEKRDADTVQLYRYSIGKQIFGIQERNELFATITNLVRETPTATPTPTTTPGTATAQSIPLKTRAYTIVPSNSGKNLLIVVPGDRVYILDERGAASSLANISPKESDYFKWSPSDSHIIYMTGEELYTVEVSSNRLQVVHKPRSSEESIEIQFVVESGIVYKIENDTVTDLVQNSFEGNNLQKIELPNIDNIRKKNLIKAYNLIDKQGIILIQTNENIFEYNLSSYELKKFNRFKGETIIFADPEREVVVTANDTNPDQFRYYNLDQNESKSFKLGTDVQSKPDQVIGFNGSQNLILRYGNNLKMIDIDGANIITYGSFESAQVILATKIDDQVEFIVKDKFNPTRQTATPSPSPTSTNTTTSPMEFVLRFEKFEN